MKMTMVQGNGKGQFDLLCFEGDDCIWEQSFDSEAAAQAFGDRFLDGEFADGFAVEVEAA